MGLSQWKTGDASPIAGTAALRNAAVSDLAGILHIKDVPVAGTLNGSARSTGPSGRHARTPTWRCSKARWRANHSTASPAR